MKKIIFIILLLPIILSSCQTYSAVKSMTFPDKDNLCIVTKDNKTYTGTAPLPKITTKKIKMKTQDGESIEINSADIAYLSAWHNNQSQEQSWRLVYTPCKEFKSSKAEDGNLEMKITDKHRWMARVVSKDNISLYIEHQEYDLDKNGKLTGKSSGSGMAPSTWYYVMRDGEDMPTRIAYASNDLMNGNVYFRAWGQKYFADCPALVAQIKDKELKTNKIVEVLEFYSSKCK